MEATDQIDRLIESRARGRKEANEEAKRQRAGVERVVQMPNPDSLTSPVYTY